MTIWWRLGGAVAVAGLVWGHGHTQGRSAQEARHERAVAALEARLDVMADRASEAEARRLEAERERNDLLADLDAEGEAADGAGRVSLPADSVRRIDAIGR